MTEKDVELVCMRQAESNLEIICYLHTSYESGMFHHCDECILKRKSCVLYAIKNAIADKEAEQ